MWKLGKIPDASLCNLDKGQTSGKFWQHEGITLQTSFQLTTTTLTLTTTVTNVTCNGGSNGAISAICSGGAGNNAFFWSNGATSSQVTGLAAGIYSLTVAECFSGTAGFFEVNDTTDNNQDVVVSSAALSCLADFPIQTGNFPDAANLGLFYQPIPGGNWVCAGVSDLNLSGTTIELFAQDTTGGPGPPVGSNLILLLEFEGMVFELTGPFSNWGQIPAITCPVFATTAVTVNQPASLSYSSFTSTHPCTGAGLLTSANTTFGISGGTSPYTYYWEPGGTATGVSSSLQTIYGLTAGTYSLSISDSQGCQTIGTWTITNSSITINPVTVTQPPCPSNTSGSAPQVNASISVAMPSGSGYSLTTIPNSGTITPIGPRRFNISNISPNLSLYLSISQNSNSCILGPYTFTQPSTFSVTPSSTPACGNSGTGTISASITGGTSPYSLVWTNGVTTSNFSAIPGNYFLTLTDNRNCIYNYGPISINSNTFNPSLSPINPTCYGQNGSITLNLSGGNGYFLVNWIGTNSLGQPQSGNENFQSPGSYSISGLPAGYYSLSITDNFDPFTNNYGSASCQYVLTTTLTDPSISFSTTPISCFGGNNGSITANANGLIGPFSYHWSNGATTQTLNGLGAGEYNITLTGTTCTLFGSTSLTQPPALFITSAITQPSCVNNGAITITSTGGSPPYSYIWNNGTTTIFPNIPNISGLSAATFNLLLTDSHGCNQVASFNLSNPYNNISVSKANVNCFGGNNGVLNFTLSLIGNYPYQAWLSNGMINTPIQLYSTNYLVFEGLTSGSYSLNILDNSGCTFTWNSTQTITQPPPLITTSSITPVVCFGGTNGAINIEVSGGTLPYQYLWNAGQTTQDLSGLAIGTFFLTTTDNKGCSKLDSVTISSPPPIQINLSVTPVSCHNFADGSISFSPQGGTPPFSISLPAGLSTNGLSGGFYNATVTDVNGCTGTQDFTVIEPLPLTILDNSIPVDPPNLPAFYAPCPGDPISASVTITGGTQPYSYLWSNGQSLAQASFYGNQLFYLTVTDTNGCDTINGYQLIDSPPLSSNYSITNPVCNQNLWNVTLEPAGGISGNAYTITFPDTAPIEVEFGDQTILTLPPGTHSYTVTQTGYGINPCLATFDLEVGPAPSPFLLQYNIQPPCLNESNGQLQLTIAGGTPGYLFSWSGPNGFFSTNEDIINIVSGEYEVFIMDSFGCSIILPITIYPLVPQTNPIEPVTP